MCRSLTTFVLERIECSAGATQPNDRLPLEQPCFSPHIVPPDARSIAACDMRRQVGESLSKAFPHERAVRRAPGSFDAQLGHLIGSRAQLPIRWPARSTPMRRRVSPHIDRAVGGPWWLR
jgi:hypothetical protein